MARFFALCYAVMALPRYKRFLDSPVSSLNHLAKTTLKGTAALSGAIGASWGSICLFAAIFPRTILPSFRFFIGGFIAGCFQSLDRTTAGKARSLYVTRASVDSLWKVGVKHRWCRGIKGGDVVVFVAALALLNTIYELQDKAVEDKGMRLLVKMLRGDVEVGLRGESKVQREKKAV